VFRHAHLRETLAPEAQQAVERALTLAPESAETHVALGQVHSMFKRYDEAERAFLHAIELDPRLFDAQYYYARFCASRGNHALAAAHYEKAYALQPDDFLPIALSIQEYQAIGDAAGERNSIARAWAGIERRLAIDPDDSAAYDHGVGVLALLGRHEESRQFGARAIAMRPHDPTTYYTGACGAVLRGDHDEALDLLERAVELGFRNADWFATDPDMGPLRSHPRYQRLVERLS
jgi:adenylate cyclase